MVLSLKTLAKNHGIMLPFLRKSARTCYGSNVYVATSVQHCIEVIFAGAEIEVYTIFIAVRNKILICTFSRAIGCIVYGIQEWISFALHFIFPWYNLFLMAFAVYCYNWNIIGTLERADDGYYRCDCKVFGEGFVRGGFTCSGAYSFSIYSFGEPIIDQSGNGFRNPYFDCELINNAIESDGYNITHTVMNIARTAATIRDDLGITQADEDEACSNWEYADL